MLLSQVLLLKGLRLNRCGGSEWNGACVLGCFCSNTIHLRPQFISCLVAVCFNTIRFLHHQFLLKTIDNRLWWLILRWCRRPLQLRRKVSSSYLTLILIRKLKIILDAFLKIQPTIALFTIISGKVHLRKVTLPLSEVIYCLINFNIFECFMGITIF